MWRAHINRGIVALAGAAMACAMGSAVPAATDPYAYRFMPIPGPQDAAPPQPAIDARHSPAYRACQQDPHATTYALDLCDQAEMKRQDDALNRQWATTIGRLGRARIAGLRAAQRAWIKGRAAHCRQASDQYAGGTMAPIVYGGCYIDETIARAIWLDRLR